MENHSVLITSVSMQILWLYLIVQKYRKLHMPMGTIQCLKWEKKVPSYQFKHWKLARMQLSILTCRCRRQPFPPARKPHNLPVILGSSYAGVYAEGDSFELLYFDITFTATVEEMLEKGRQWNGAKETVVLDDSPHCSVCLTPGDAATEEENTFQAISYSCRANWRRPVG